MNNENLLQIAFSQYGIKEIKGSNHNDEILKYFKETGHEWVKTDETAWCSAFINWCAFKIGLGRSNQLTGRSWLKVGKKIKKPELGDIVVFWRDYPQSWKGHVAIYINTINENIYVLGGNQNNCVCIKSYPKNMVLGFRRLLVNE